MNFHSAGRGLLTGLLLLSAAPSFGWGTVGHRYASGLAVEDVPTELKPLYAANKEWIVAHSSDPDHWREQDRSEAPHHFIDLDKWGLEDAKNFPHDYWVACGLYGKDAVDKNGVVPWRIGQYYAKLVVAFKKRDARAIVDTSAWLGHYVADIHVPFHACANYDGQLTGQKGVHARFESVMVERQIAEKDLKTAGTVRISDPVAAAFGWTQTSLKRSFDVLAADKAAAVKDGNYGDEYYKTFGAKARPIALAALNESGRDLASLWAAAWIAAGKPALPDAANVHASEPLNAPTHDPDANGLEKN